jgi:hypothetical protein
VLFVDEADAEAEADGVATEGVATEDEEVVEAEADTGVDGTLALETGVLGIFRVDTVAADEVPVPVAATTVLFEANENLNPLEATEEPAVEAEGCSEGGLGTANTTRVVFSVDTGAVAFADETGVDMLLLECEVALGVMGTAETGGRS